MTRVSWLRASGAGLALFAAACTAPVEEVVDKEAAVELPPVSAEAPEVTLLFPGADGRLHPEVRRLVLAETARERIAGLVRALLAGPEGEDLAAPLPALVEVGTVFVDSAGIAYLDLRGPDGAEPPPSGSQTELLAVYSLVNTILFNVEEARAVVILWNGTQRPSLAGHVDTGRPLRSNPRLMADEM